MNIGELLIALALACAVVSTFSYFLTIRGYKKYESLGQISYYYFTVIVLSASALLFYYFLSGDYSYKYVYDYSASQMNTFFLIAAFWGGQQGTYLLWLAFLALFGYFLLFRTEQYKTYSMFFYGIILIFFSTMLMILSPFEKLPFPQPDGAGLNPLLMDYWMVIHPPVMFIGYAAAALPFVIALSALFTNKYKGWLKIIFGPVILVSTALAAGNIMGAFWAYKTLGWGGYWGWDPVENSSLIPWLISLALIHGLVLERDNGAMRKTNLFLSLSVFVLVIYGTFLTRSGVLADFSVHSFVDLGANGVLISFMIGSALVALLLFLYRFLEIKGPSVNLSITSRPFTLIFSVWVLSLIAVIVLAGTSWPLITGLFGTAGAVDTDVYNRIVYPLAILMGIFLSIAPFAPWKGSAVSLLIKKLLIPIIASVAITTTSFFYGVESVTDLLYIFSASLAMTANLRILITFIPRELHKAGPQLAHFGFSLMLLGILGSSAYATSEKLAINRDESATAFGMNITYQGMANEITTTDNKLLLAVTDNGLEYQATPQLYWSSRMGGMMKKPHISRHLMYDIYFSPEQIQDMSDQNGVAVGKGEIIQLGGYQLKFNEFDQGEHDMGSSMRFGAVLEVKDSLGNSELITPALSFDQGKVQYLDVPLMEGVTDFDVRLEQINADNGSIVLSVKGLTPNLPKDRLILEVSKKPTMNFLWAGTILLVLGSLISLRSRWVRAITP
ncbi:MAG: cytochrome c biogenesis protein CcsA [candidate division Zixibacteria bacterium]|nr:cytochrome c biogenesis protein CcsA [candidate division Zixibacteria bacterium]